MKYMNIIKLLSVLLCIGMLFVACDTSSQGDDAQTSDTQSEAGTANEAESNGSTEDSTEAATEEKLLENVEAKFENFFELIAEEESAAITDATRVDGEIVAYDSYARFIVMKSSDIDTKNNVTETFKLYNTSSGSITLEFNNTYFNGDYDSFDWDEIMVKENVTFVNSGYGYVEHDATVKYPESVMDIEIGEVGDLSYVILKEAKITPIDEEIREENPEGCVYEIYTTYTYYDVYGNKLVSSPEMLAAEELMSNDNVILVKFGGTVVYFDAESLEAVESSSATTDKLDGVYDSETDAYGYYLYRENYVASLGSAMYFEVVDKATGELAYCYYLDNNYEYTDTFVLHNGDVLIQYENEVEEGDPYDYTIYGNQYWEIEHAIFSVKDGSVTEIDIPYYIWDVVDGETFCDEYLLEDDGIRTTANARNIAYAYYIGDGIYDQADVVIFDNDMSVLYVLDRIVPEHKIDVDYALGVSILANGDYLVDLNDIVTDRAIVRPDGTVRAYLKSDMEVIGNYVVMGDDIYDYDLNHLYDLSEDSYRVVGELLGDLIVADDEVDLTWEYTSYYKVTDADGDVGTTQLFGDDVKIVDATDEYVIVQRGEDDKYVLYNEELSSVLVTYDSMTISEFNGGYIVVTLIDGQYVLYEIN